MEDSNDNSYATHSGQGMSTKVIKNGEHVEIVDQLGIGAFYPAVLTHSNIDATSMADGTFIFKSNN